MDLDFSPEQDLLRESVRGICARHAGLEVVRKLEDDPIGYPPAFWEALAELGLCGLTIDEAHGGSGMSLLDAVIVYEELGRSLAPSPHFVSSVVSAGVIERLGTGDQKAEWLPRISSGEAIVTPAWLEAQRGFGPDGVALEAAPAGDGWTLTGTKRHVAFARAASALLVLARHRDEVLCLLVDPTAGGVTFEQQLTIASDTQYEVRFDDVTIGPEARLGDGSVSGWDAFDATMHDAIVLLAAQASGGARHAHDITVQYAKDRKQFDKPLGAFQAIAHYLADGVTAVDGAETLVWEAAWARDQGRSIARLAPMAKLFATQTFRDITAKGQQIFGGVGFTVDYDIQLYFRRAKQLQISWWDSRYLEERVAAEVLDR